MTQRGISLALALLAALALPAAGAALDLDRAKGEELVGEKADGFVGIVVAEPAPWVVALVKDVNAKRRVGYEAIAKKNGTTADAVALLAGAKLIERASRGEWVTDAEGNWRKK